MEYKWEQEQNKNKFIKLKKICNEFNCYKGARSGYDKCKTHGGGKRCIISDCKKSAADKSDKCKLHGGGIRCNESDCKNSARSKSDKCTTHGGGKRCIISNCKKSARDKYDKCKAHGGGLRCIISDCKKSARDKYDKCVEHGGGKICNEHNCKKSTQGKSDKCNAHGGGIRCPNCITWPDSRGSSNKYDGYCATCFKRIFPNDERSKVIYAHTKEIRVRNTINEMFDGFIHDKPLYTGNCDCTHRRRIDHRKLIGNTILAIETDENAHNNYDDKDEEIRYDDLFMIHSGKWIFIRFNPDGKNIDMEDKLNKLIETIQEQIDRIENEENNELIEIIKLFYNYNCLCSKI